MTGGGPVAWVANALAVVAAVLLFLIGAMLTYEVVARYFFNAPTIWAEELSRLFLTWAVFLASAALLRSNDHIRVTVLLDLMPRPAKKVAHVTSLTFVAVIAGLVAWHGFPTVAKSFATGRSSGSMLDIPQWWSQAAIPLCFGLLSLQALILTVSTVCGGWDPFDYDHKGDERPLTD
ncbi:TRAP transporter small permease [Acuticoccus mangrovi]|uniref:TRAP transporter small permease protein n=1 Tax=Acuticoccus mangrovi TaxID=2796142 RepID=A0A934IM01_9HYPH|nr:TRAP transporter small permease [Acuticoccus mangrovi]MBJ3774375.1 TRAP transporter small permease [Acuticoccus mangrovi]